MMNIWNYSQNSLPGLGQVTSKRKPSLSPLNFTKKSKPVGGQDIERPNISKNSVTEMSNDVEIDDCGKFLVLLQIRHSKKKPLHLF